MFWVRWAPREHCSVLFYAREAAGTQDIIVKLTKPSNVSPCLQRCFLSVTCLIQAFYDRFYVPITVQRRKSHMQKTMGKKWT